MKSRNEYQKLLSPYKIGLELGVEFGNFSEQLLSNWDGNLVCVDFWEKQENYNEPPNEKNFGEMFSIFNQKIKPYSERVLVIKNLSETASKFFPDSYFDFIFIDANHEYSQVKKDIELWWPKLKSKGLFSGHDWLHNFIPNQNGNMSVFYCDMYIGEYGVNTAVSQFCIEHNYQINTTDEEFATWYFYKK